MSSSAWGSLLCCIPSTHQRHRHTFWEKGVYLPPGKSPRKSAFMEPINIRPDPLGPDEEDIWIQPERRVKFDKKIQQGLLPASAIKFGQASQFSGPPKMVTDEGGRTYSCTGSFQANWSARGSNNSARDDFLVTDSSFPDDCDVLLPMNRKNRDQLSSTRKRGTIQPTFRFNKKPTKEQEAAAREKSAAEKAAAEAQFEKDLANEEALRASQITSGNPPGQSNEPPPSGSATNN